ncbi:MAG: type II toxin-antitoxin system VapC family toxin [Candidatus Hodarchaeales archaeon]
MLIYLDSSVIVKRYIEEKGTMVADYIYDKASDGYITIIFNILNIGEVLGVFNKYFRLKKIDQEELQNIKRKFISETLKLMRINRLIIIPTSNQQQMSGWPLVLSDRLYIVDAIQITSYQEQNASLFLSGDEYLVSIAKKSKLNAFSIKDEKDIVSMIETYQV